VQYTPPALWAQNGQCTTCTANPNINSAFNQTYHDGIFNADPQSTTNGPETILSLSFAFNGSALYIYCIVPQQTTFPGGGSDMSFYIDGQIMGTYTNLANGTSAFGYNVLVFQNESIPAGIHTFQLNNGYVGGPTSLVIFDKLVYSYDNGIQASSTSVPQSSSSSKNKTIVIVAATVGSVGGLCVVGLLLYFLRRRQKNTSTLPTVMSEVDPFPIQPSRTQWQPNRLGLVNASSQDPLQAEEHMQDTCGLASSSAIPSSAALPLEQARSPPQTSGGPSSKSMPLASTNSSHSYPTLSGHTQVTSVSSLSPSSGVVESESMRPLRHSADTADFYGGAPPPSYSEVQRG